jgi:uncharacterized membrane protein YoaK (UPF0700 family)
MSRSPTATRTTVLLFTWAAGSVDAITYLAAHVFTANMTGNAVLLGIAVGQGKGPAAASSFIALLAFAAGVILGAMVVGEGDPASAPALVRRAVWLETLVLAFFAAAAFAPLQLSSRATVLLLIVSSGLAMGMQSAAVRRLKLPGIATTYITGTITSFLSGLVHHRRLTTSLASESQVASLRPSLALQAEVFLSYALSAVACAFLHTRWPSAIALLPLLALIGVDVSLSRHRTAVP